MDADALKNYKVTLVRKNTIHQIVIAAASQRDALDQINAFSTAVIKLHGKRYRQFADRLYERR